jgi:hypothetical protein
VVVVVAVVPATALVGWLVVVIDNLLHCTKKYLAQFRHIQR